jgi:glycine/D-amino acid oxidase-like deaminating enzyme
MVASACSGHGFKFAPVVGEILADLVTSGSTKHDIARFAATDCLIFCRVAAPFLPAPPA